ncbi:MAG: MFS transporter [Luteolibacter sp.]
MTNLIAKEKSNAAKLITALTSTKLGDALINPKTVLTWLLTQMGVSGALVALLVPIRESGSMLPQLFVSGWVKKVKLRKYVYVSGAMAQALAVAVMGAVVLFLPPTLAGLGMLLAVAMFSVARAFCSISGKDVLGRTIPKGYRGRVGGVSATISGVVTTIAALVLIFVKDEASARSLAWVVLAASLLWVIGGTVYLRINETADESKESESESNDVFERLLLVKEDPIFRRFIIARILLLGSALASPLLVVLAGREGSTLKSLGAFVIASGLASGSSSFLWGKLSDKASHVSMAVGGFISALIGGLALGVGWFSPNWAANPLVWALMFLIFNLGYAGVRMGRKTWVVDVAKGDRRTDFVSTSNTVIAVSILALGAISSPLQSMSPLLPLGLYSLFCAIGGCIALKIKPNADDLE